MTVLARQISARHDSAASFIRHNRRRQRRGASSNYWPSSSKSKVRAVKDTGRAGGHIV